MAKKEKPRKKEEHKKPRVHKALEGFEVSIDQFGELKSNMSIEAINAFLDKNVEDKKLAERDDYEELKKGKKKNEKKKK
jgi:hypothetical protein